MKETVMSERDYDYALYKINETLKQEDVENKDGIVSFYDMIEYGRKGLKDLIDVTSQKSKLAKELDDSNFNPFTKYHTFVHTETSFINDTCESTIVISTGLSDERVTLTKDKNIGLTSLDTSNEKLHTLVNIHFDSILKTFSTLEKYSKLFGSIKGREYCYIGVYDSFFYVRLYYNDYGKIETELHLPYKYDLTQKLFCKKTLKEILEKNKNELLKKFPIDLSRDLRLVGENHILLLAQQEYFKEQENEKQISKKKILK